MVPTPPASPASTMSSTNHVPVAEGLARLLLVEDVVVIVVLVVRVVCGSAAQYGQRSATMKRHGRTYFNLKDGVSRVKGSGRSHV